MALWTSPFKQKRFGKTQATVTLTADIWDDDEGQGDEPGQAGSDQ
jgi:hypothetical protein